MHGVRGAHGDSCRRSHCVRGRHARRSTRHAGGARWRPSHHGSLSDVRFAARHIWDTGVQCICAVVSARAEHGVELFLSANFAQLSTTPPRIGINPNRLYPIEPAIRSAGRFAINIMPSSSREQMSRLLRIRRREPRKADVLGWTIETSEDGTPFVPSATRTLFCELESAHDTGDHTLMIARVVAVRDGACAGLPPLQFGDLLDAATPTPMRVARWAFSATGAVDIARLALARVRPPPPADLPRTTYEIGGHGQEEIAIALAHGVVDTGRRLRPPAPVVPRGSIGRAEGTFTDIEQAAADPRVQALVLILPHDEHRRAVDLVISYGKDVMVEKPIATTLSDADAMIAAAHARGVRLMVAEDMHFRPTIGEAARRIERGDIGEPLYLLAHGGGVFHPRGWKSDPHRAGGGVLMDVGVHYVRALRLLLGEPASVVASRAMQMDTHARVEDSVQLMFSSDAGWQSHMLLSWASTRGHAPDLVVLGERGTLHLWAGAAHLDLYPIAPRPLSTLLQFVRPAWLQSALRSPTLQRIRIRLPRAEGTGHAACFREFISAIEEGRAPATSAADARRDLEIVLRGYEALASGTSVAL